MLSTLEKDTPNSVGLDPDRIQLINDRLHQWVNSGRTPAISALIVRRGKIVLQEAIGQRKPDLPFGSLETDDLFPIMSVTKPFVVAAAMLLVEDGELSLNRRVKDYIPELEGKWTDEILVHHLMTHSAGYKEWDLFSWVANNPIGELPPKDENQHPWNHKNLCERYHAPLQFQPGTENSYGIHCISLLGEVVRRVSGQAFHEYIEDRILRPLGMNNSMFVPNSESKDRLVYRSEDVAFGNANYPFILNDSLDIPSAAGGLLSTTADLAVWGQMFINGGTYNGTRVLSPATVREMTRNQTPGIPTEGWGGRMIPESSWGLGWMIQGPEKWPYWTGSLQPLGTVYHQGIGASFMWIDIPNEVIGVYLTIATEFDMGVGEPNWDLDMFQNMVSAAVID